MPEITAIIAQTLSLEQRESLTIMGFQAEQIGQDPEIAWTIQMQRWAKEEIAAGHPLAILGLADLVGEECLLRLEKSHA